MSTFDDAMAASTGTWAPPQVHADWASDGYNGDNSIDDLSPLVGAITVHQALDDGMPSDITYTSGQDSTSSAQFPVGAPIRLGLRPDQYWSQDNGGSPISGYERDVAALTVAHGPVTATGIQRATVFTGRMSDALIAGRQVTVDGVSSTRLKLTTPVQLPGVSGLYEGCNATWPIMYTLVQCGLYVSPPPRSGCRWWAPMHGSLRPMVPANSTVGTFRATTNLSILAGASTFSYARPTFVTGPFLLGVYSQLTTPQSIAANVILNSLAPGADLYSQAASAGRVEFWVRGDAADTATGAAVVFYGSLSKLVGFQFKNNNATQVDAGVGLDRKVFVRVQDGTHDVTLKSSVTVPTDGAWHFVGAAWNVAGNKLWVNMDGTAASSVPSPALSTGGLPATDDYFSNNGGTFVSYLPTAEVHLTSGAQASPDTTVWVNDTSYWTSAQAGVVIRPSILELVGLAEPLPVEGASYIASIAQAELAMTRTDELDRYNYLPMPYWAEAAQQTPAEVISTSHNVGTDLAITRDLTKIRNSVVVSYTDTRLDDTFSVVYVGFTPITVPSGVSTVKVLLPGPVFNVVAGTLYNLTAADIANPAGIAPNSAFAAINAAPDGSGAWATTAQVSVTPTAWTPGSITLTFTNTTGQLWYVTTGGHSTAPFLQLSGYKATSGTASTPVAPNNPFVDQASINLRGVRGITPSLPAIQDLQAASFIARELLYRMKKARRQATLTVRGDPRRQPGNLVRLQDPLGTAVNSLWRILAIDHNINGAEYTQTLTLIEAALVGVWDQSTWDDGPIWGP